MFNDDKIKLFSMAYSEHKLIQHQDIFYKAYDVFNDLIYDSLIKKHDSYYFYKNKKESSKNILKLMKKYALDFIYDDFHNVFRFSFTYKVRNKIHFMITCDLKDNYNLYKLEFSRQYYERNYRFSSIPLLHVFNQFKNNSNIFSRKNIIIYYDFFSGDSYDKQYGENVYIELKNKFYSISECIEINNISDVRIKRYYDEKIKLYKNSYSAYVGNSYFDIEHLIKDDNFRPVKKIYKSTYYQNISYTLCEIIKSHNIFITDLNDQHINLADMQEY